MKQKTKNNRVLLLDTNHELLEQKLSEAGFHCDYFPQLDLSGLKEIIGNYSGIIIRSRFHLNRELLTLAKDLAFIGRVGAGMEGIDIDFATSSGIRCFNAPEGNRNAVGEHAIGMLLVLANKLLIANNEVRNGIWKREENRGIEIKGRTVGIIGYGNTGGSFARKLYGFGCKVLAFDKYKSGFSDEFVIESGMSEIFKEADILSLHVPLTDETEYLVDKDYLEKFRKNIILINTSRGKVVKTDDLVETLKTGKVSGAALDVLEYESESFENLNNDSMPAPLHYLISSDKTILSPHIAGWTVESKRKLAEVIVGKVLAEFKAPA